jgi:hypothetical protein
MIRHIVVAKFKPETPPAEIKEVLDGLRKLPEQIPDIIGYEFGLDEVHGERSYDFALVSTFQDIEAQNRYQVNPIHLAVARRLRAASQHLVTVDFRV